MATYIEDADNDTTVQTEESADEDKIRFDTAGTQRMIIDDSGDVGIGVTSPSQKLEVLGHALFTGPGGYDADTEEAAYYAGDTSSYLKNTYNGDLELTSNNPVTIKTTSASKDITLESGRDIILNAGGNEIMRIDAGTERVGVGTAAPGAMIDVRGSAVFNEDGEDHDFRIEGDSEPNLLFVDAGNDRIGIGTVNPEAKLDVPLGSAGTPTTLNLQTIRSKVITNLDTGSSTALACSTLINTELGDDADVYYSGILQEMHDSAPNDGDHVGIASLAYAEDDRNAGGKGSNGDSWALWGSVNNQGYQTSGVGLEINCVNQRDQTEYFDVTDSASDSIYATVGQTMLGLLLTPEGGYRHVTRAIGIAYNTSNTRTGTGTIQSSGTTVTGAGTNFDSVLRAGDFITANGQERQVTNVGSSTSLTIASAFSPDLSSGTDYTFFNLTGWDTGIQCSGFLQTGIYINSPLEYRNGNNTAPRVGIRFGDDLTNLIRIQETGPTDFWGLNAETNYLTWRSRLNGTAQDLLVLYDDSTNARVGIGTTSPGYPFEVVPGSGSSFSVAHEGGRPVVRILDTSTNDPVLQFNRNSVAANILYDGTDIDVQNALRCDSLRIDQSPATGSISPDKYFTISLNGTTYKVPCTT